MSYNDWEFAVRSREEIVEKGLGGWYDILIGGKSGEKTRADFEKAGYIVIPASEFDELKNQHERSICGDWKEITEHEYEDALNVLPPAKWHSGGFFVSEPYSSTIYSFYQKRSGKYYTSLQDIFTPRAEIIESLDAFIERS